jgi:hypothetical protein
MEPDSSEGLGSGLSRRKFVAGSAAGFATVSLAGCAGDDGETETTTTEPEPENYVVTDDIIVSGTGAPANNGYAQACQPSRIFSPGMHPVFKIGVYDPETGDQLTNDDLSAVTVNIDGYGTVDLAWSGDDEEHPADEWSGSWAIPMDASAGSVSYTVEITAADDASPNFRNVGILESQFSVIEDRNDYIVTDDLYSGSAGVGDHEDNKFVSSCQPDRQFAPDMMVGFDIGVYESSTGMPVSPSDFTYEDSVQGPIEAVEVVIEAQDDTPGTVEDPVHTVTCEWAGYEGEHAAKGEDLFYNGVWHMGGEVDPGTYQYTVNIVLTDEAAGNINGEIAGAAANTFTVVDA